MAIIIQDDNGSVTNANSYSDVAFTDTYFTLRGNTDWAALSVAEKEVSLIKTSISLAANSSGEII